LLAALFVKSICNLFEAAELTEGMSLYAMRIEMNSSASTRTAQVGAGSRVSRIEAIGCDAT
jgi:hypothetical protein